MIGTSLLSMPWALGQAGLALGVGLMVLMALITCYTAYRTVKSADDIGQHLSRSLFLTGSLVVPNEF